MTPLAPRYCFLDKRSKELKFVPPERESDFFSAIERLTGLDRAAVELFLKNGKPLHHPSYEFRKVTE